MLFIGKRIKDLRIKKGITQLELANALFVSDRAISKWEREKGNPDLELIVKIAEYFSVNLDYLITGKTNEFVEKANDYKYLIDYFNDLISPLILDKFCEREIERLLVDYPACDIQSAIDKFFRNYFRKLDENERNHVFLKNNINKIEGILHNNSLSQTDQILSHIINLAVKNSVDGKNKYIVKRAIKEMVYIDDFDEKTRVKILKDLKNKLVDNNLDLDLLINECRLVINNLIREENNNKNGFLIINDYGPLKLDGAVSRFNVAYVQNDETILKMSMLYIFETLLKNLAYSFDKRIDLKRIPDILSIKNNLYVIFDGYIGKPTCSSMVRLIDKCNSNGFFSDLYIEDLQKFERIVGILEKKIRKKLNGFAVKYQMNTQLLFSTKQKS